MEIVVATKNKGKIKEIREALKDIDIKILSLDEIGLEIEIEEDGKTYSENAVKKAVEVAKKSGKISLADDSGLEIDALNGKPGINSSRFAGDDADDRERNLKVLEMMKDVSHGKRGARFRCIIAIAEPNGKSYTCEGVCEGEIAERIRGAQGFGYDPIFIPHLCISAGYECSKTFGELGSDVKDKISHRAKALEKAGEIIKSRLME
jgi:XTP/dITP diphosphohydrolase